MAWSSGLQLRVMSGERERRDRVIRLDGKELKLGRAAKGQRPGPGELLFKEPTVSRVHARLSWKQQKGGFQLVHASKTNPTLVNGRPTKKILLAPGDKVQLGMLILQLEDAPGGRTSSASRAKRSSMTEPILEALSKVERDHAEEQRRTRAEREEKQRQREILASPDRLDGAPSSSVPRRTSRLDEALRAAPYDPNKEEDRKKRRPASFGWRPPEEREPDEEITFQKEIPPEPSWSAPVEPAWSPPPEVAYQEPPPPPREVPIISHSEPEPPPVMVGNEVDSEPVYELYVVQGPDKGRRFALKDIVMVLGQKQSDDDERAQQGVLLNDATLPSELGMFVWQGREGAYGLLASEDSMQMIEVERIDQGQKRRIKVDSHSSILLRVADEIQFGLTTLRVQKIGQEFVEPEPVAPIEEPRMPVEEPYHPVVTPGKPKSLRQHRSDGLKAPTPRVRPESPQRQESAQTNAPPSESEVPIWAAGTLGPGSASQESSSTPTSTPSPPPARSKLPPIEALEWGSRPKVDFLLEFIAGPLRGCQISLSHADLERVKRLNAGSPGNRTNEISLEDPEITNEAFHLNLEDGRFSLCNESDSGHLVINRSPIKTGDRLVLMTGDVISIGRTQIRFLERNVVETLSRYGLIAESGVTVDQDRIFPLNRQRLLIGRGKACDVRLSDLEVSRVHLGLAFGDGSFSIQHRSETNPTFLNGLALPPGTVRKVKEGDRIRLSSLTVLRLISR